VVPSSKNIPVESLVEAVDQMEEFFTLERQLEEHSDIVYDIPSLEEVRNGKLKNTPGFSSSAETILRFLEPSFDILKNSKITREEANVDYVLNVLTIYSRMHPEEKELVMKELVVSELIIPVVCLDLPLKMIVEYNRMEHTDPRFPFYCIHPEVKLFGLFLDKFDTDKRVICSIVWSNIDKGVVPLANINLKPYPLCWNSSTFNDFGCKAFGVKRCGKCSIARYCSKECQIESWPDHKNTCGNWRKNLERCYVVTL